MKSEFFLRIQCVIFVAICFGRCGPPDPQPYFLKIAESHRKLLTDIRKPAYTAKEAIALFKVLDKKGAEYCANPNKSAVTRLNFLNESAKAAFGSEFYSAAGSAVSGCENRYLLSDFRYAQALGKVEDFYPGMDPPLYTCVSLGLMEPYLMASRLYCRTLHIVSTDFRILKAHTEILHKLQSVNLKNIGNLISELELRFVTELDSTPDARPLKLTSEQLCGKKHAQDCRHSLAWFKTNFKSLQNIQLHLGQLGDVLPDISTENFPVVIYLKDAVEPKYMSEGAFDRVITSAAAMGGATALYRWPTFQGYAIYNIDRNRVVQTLCADEFRQFVPGHYSPEEKKYYVGTYRSHVTRFDKISTSRKKTSCTAGRQGNKAAVNE